MADLSAIAGAMGALRGTKDILEAMVGLRDEATFRAKQLELQGKIIDAQTAVFSANEERTALLEKVAQLEKTIKALEDWEAEERRYKRAVIGKHVVAYIPQESETPKEADHWLCANCFDQRQKSYLQQVPLSVNRSLVVACPQCKSVNYVAGQAVAEHANILAKFGR